MKLPQDEIIFEIKNLIKCKDILKLTDLTANLL